MTPLYISLCIVSIYRVLHIKSFFFLLSKSQFSNAWFNMRETTFMEVLFNTCLKITKNMNINSYYLFYVSIWWYLNPVTSTTCNNVQTLFYTWALFFFPIEKYTSNYIFVSLLPIQRETEQENFRMEKNLEVVTGTCHFFNQTLPLT